MYSYFYGTVVSINKKSITFDSQGKGYIINVSNPSNFMQGSKIHLYVYNQLTQNKKNGMIEDIYGFKTYNEKELFLNLIRCNGIGPKTALSICNNDNEIIKQLIVKQDIQNLAKCHAINEKIAKTIIDELYDYYAKKQISDQNSIITELFSALNSLGYKETDIRFAINELMKNLNVKDDLSNLIASAIKIIVNKSSASANNGIN